MQESEEEEEASFQTILCVPEEHHFDDNSYVYQGEQNGSEHLYQIYFDILKNKRKIAPVFSGNLGENIYENSARMLELFKDLPAGPGEPTN